MPRVYRGGHEFEGSWGRLGHGGGVLECDQEQNIYTGSSVEDILGSTTESKHIVELMYL